MTPTRSQLPPKPMMSARPGFMISQDERGQILRSRNFSGCSPASWTARGVLLGRRLDRRVDAAEEAVEVVLGRRPGDGADQEEEEEREEGVEAEPGGR